MITLTVLVLALGLAWGLTKAWNRTAEMLSRKPAAIEASEQVAAR